MVDNKNMNIQEAIEIKDKWVDAYIETEEAIKLASTLSTKEERINHITNVIKPLNIKRSELMNEKILTLDDGTEYNVMDEYIKDLKEKGYKL